MVVINAWVVRAQLAMYILTAASSDGDELRARTTRCRNGG
jgi:hypothetical protein